MVRSCRTTILSLSLLLTYRPLKSELTTCPTSNGYVHDVTSGLCVILLPDWVARDAAVRMCEDRGDRLLWLDTALKETFFRDFARTDGDSYWLVGYRTGSGSWEWSDSDQLCHASWSPDQPDGTGDCMAVANWYDWQWDDVPCNQHMRPACERPTATAVRGCGQLNTSTPIVLSTTEADDVVSSRIEVISTSPSSLSTTRSEVTATAVAMTKHISGTPESTDDVMYVSAIPPATTISTSPVELDIDRRSTDITLRGASSIALSSTTATMPETLDASSRMVGIGNSDIAHTLTYTSFNSMESDGHRVESDGFMSSSYVSESLDSSAYIGQSSGSTIYTNVQITSSSGPTIDSSVHITSSSGSTIDSSVHITSSSGSTIDSSVHITSSSGSSIDSSVYITSSSGSTIDSNDQITSSSGSTIDSSVHITSSSGSTIDSNVQITSSSSSTIDPSVQITSSSGSTIDPSVQITSSSGYAVSTLTRSILETNSDLIPIKDYTEKTSVASSTSVISDSSNLLYSISTLPSPTQTTVTTSPTTTPCRCFCEPKHRYNALRFDDLQQRKEEVRESLLLDKRGLAKFEARYTSADDQRPSSYTIASVGMAIFVACGCLVILSDVITLVRAKTKKNTHK